MNRVIGFLSVFLFAPLSVSFASHHSGCPDESYFTVVGGDGNRYGWFENASCVFEETEVHRSEYPACPDGSIVTAVGGNGISYGWHQEATCIVENGATAELAPEMVVDETVEEPMESTTDSEFSAIAGTWDRSFFSDSISVRQNNEDGTFVDLSRSLDPFDAEDCFSVWQTGSYSFLGDDFYEVTSLHVRDTDATMETVKIRINDDGTLAFRTEPLWDPVDFEINECVSQ